MYDKVTSLYYIDFVVESSSADIIHRLDNLLKIDTQKKILYEERQETGP